MTRALIGKARQLFERLVMLPALGVPGLWRTLACWLVVRYEGAARGDAFSSDTQLVMLVSLVAATGWQGLVMVQLARAKPGEIRSTLNRTVVGGLAWSLGAVVPAAWLGAQFGLCASWQLPSLLMGQWVVWQLGRQASIALGRPRWTLEGDLVGLLLAGAWWALRGGSGHEWSESVLVFMGGSALWIWGRAMIAGRGTPWLGTQWIAHHKAEFRGVLDVGVANLLGGGVGLLSGFLAFKYADKGIATFTALMMGFLMPVILASRALVMAQAPDLVRQLDADRPSARHMLLKMMRQAGLVGAALAGISMIPVGIMIHCPTLLLGPRAMPWQVPAAILWAMALAASATVVVGQMALPGSYLILAMRRTRITLLLNVQFAVGALVACLVLAWALGPRHGTLMVSLVSVVVAGLTVWRTRRLHRLTLREMETCPPSREVR